MCDCQYALFIICSRSELMFEKKDSSHEHLFYNYKYVHKFMGFGCILKSMHHTNWTLKNQN
jgi:hypothetical protein